MIRIVLMSVFLVICTIWDIKTKKLPLILFLCFGLAGVVINLALPKLSLSEVIMGTGIGLVLLLISYLTEGQIGNGDGILFIITGLYTGVLDNLELLLWSTIICAFFAGVLLMTKQLKRKDRIPFVPFVLFAYIVQVIL